MFGIGWTEFIVIALVLLIFVGPKNLPPLLRKVGGVLAEFKSASRELRNQLDVEVKALELDKAREAVDNFKKDALGEVNRPYEELKKADREFKRGMIEAQDEIRKDVKGHLGLDGKPVANTATEVGEDEEKPVRSEVEMGE